MNKNIIYKIKHYLIAVAIPLILYLFLLCVSWSSMSGTQIFDILRQAMLPAILGWGMAFACKLGIWHFAAGANVITGVIIGAGIGNRLGGNPMVIVICIIAISTLIGLLCGLTYVWIKVPSIIATVGCMLILESISALVWGGGGITVNKSSYAIFNSVPVVTTCTVIIFLIAYFIYTYTKYGFMLKAVSSSVNIAEQQGINVTKIKVITFVLVGLFSGFYGFLTLARSFKQVPMTNMGSMELVFSAIICFFVAAAVERHVNLMIGVYIGSVTVQLIKFAIVALGIDGQFNNTAIAVALIFFSAMCSESETMKTIRSKLKICKRKTL